MEVNCFKSNINKNLHRKTMEVLLYNESSQQARNDVLE